jgi:hypothetical protein
MLQRLPIIRADRAGHPGNSSYRSATAGHGHGSNASHRARDTGRRSREAERDDSIPRAAHARRKA